MSTVKTINIVHPSGSTTNIVNDSSGNMTVGGTMAMSSSFMRNRIINGAMIIDQRNAGASVTVTSTGTFGADRWYGVEDTDGTMTMQQSATAPANFNYSLLFTTGTADTSLSATQYCIMGQQIEGFNVADLGWGTASAQTVTLSFWVRSSLTGVFGGALRNSSGGRSYPFTYTISSANTWEQKSVTIVGDTSGTWVTDNGLGIRLTFGLGVGSTYSGTAGAWSGLNVFSATGATSVIGTAGATFYITGVQLEVGTVATPFEREIYSNTLAKCLRYYQTIGSAGSEKLISGANGTAAVRGAHQFPVIMRSSPTFTVSGTPTFYSFSGSNPTYSSTTVLYATTKTFAWYLATSAVTAGVVIETNLTGGSGGLFTFDAEL